MPSASLEGNVTLDGVAVTLGQEVTTASSKLVIHEGSQASLISPFGTIERLGAGEHDVAVLGDIKQWLAKSPMGHYDGPVIRPGRNKKKYLLGDVVSLSWVGPTIEKPLKMRIMNEYGDVFLDTIIQSRVDIKNFPRFFREKELTVVEIWSGKKVNETISIAPIGDEQRKKLEHDLAQIENHPYKDILTIAILEAHQLELDAVVRLIRMGKLREDTPLDLKNYIWAKSQAWFMK